MQHITDPQCSIVACQSKHWKTSLKEQSIIILHTWDEIFFIFKLKKIMHLIKMYSFAALIC